MGSAGQEFIEKITIVIKLQGYKEVFEACEVAGNEWPSMAMSKLPRLAAACLCSDAFTVAKASAFAPMLL
jgi:hypothetical protein